MADVALDYGSAETDPSAAVPMQDDAMEEDGAQQSGSRFYPISTDQAVEAGAQRGPAPSSGAETSLDDAALVGTAPPSETPDPPAVEGGSDIRLDTLLIEGTPITQLSTSRLFAYLTHFGAQPLGLEWIDDRTCKIVFADERSARLGLEYLLPPSASDDMQAETDLAAPLPNIDTLLEYDPDSWHSEYITSLVTPRQAHRVPAKLYNLVERQAALTELEVQKQTQDAVSALPDDVPEIYREMEEADRKKELPREVRDLQKLRGLLWLRHAVTDVDRKESRASTRSQWYKRHGYEAGREIVPKLLQVGEVKESVELFPDWKPSTTGGDDDRRRRKKLDELDEELDGYRAARDEPRRREGEMMADAVRRRDGDLMDRLHSRRGDRRHDRNDDGGRWGHDAYESLSSDRHRGRRSRRTDLESLDQELDDLRHTRHQQQYHRELSPSRRQRTDDRSGRTKVKGRGRMKAPGFDDRWSAQEEDSKSLSSRMGGGGELLTRLGDSRGSLADRFS
ncbi:hypothetical protein PHBOTO_004036 [Pseudozyma hubeiensis]|nr:hypothetical protein PHBOTO_004036 [Pseudozyma hubeiensis]